MLFEQNVSFFPISSLELLDLPYHETQINASIIQTYIDLYLTLVKRNTSLNYKYSMVWEQISLPYLPTYMPHVLPATIPCKVPLNLVQASPRSDFLCWP